LTIDELQFSDYRAFVTEWLTANPMWDDKENEEQ
jgi:hypothetical protein